MPLFTLAFFLRKAIALVADKLGDVKHKLLVLSGKGGVGKSTVATQMAYSLALQGHTVGLLDVDICGPSVPRMLGLSAAEVHKSGSGWTPILVNSLPDDCDGELLVMSVGFMLPNQDDAVIWRGPRKNGLIKQFLTDVDWGTLDYLIVDTPPGTSDEHLSIVQYLRGAGLDGAVVVTTPQEVAMADVRKELNFCAKTKVRVLGVVENMASFTCGALGNLTLIDPSSGADCSEAARGVLARVAPELLHLVVRSDLLPRSGGGPEAMAVRFGVPYLGALPMDPDLTAATEAGLSLIQHRPSSSAAAPLRALVARLVANIQGGGNFQSS